MAKIKSKGTSLFVKIIFALLIIYLLYVFINLQVKIADKKSQISDLDVQISIASDENEQLKSTRDAEMDEEYTEKVAREHGYVNSDEKVYEVVS